MSSESIPADERSVESYIIDLADGINSLLPNISDFFIHILGQVRIWKKTYPGIMHALIFWGVTVQVVGTIINLLQMRLFIPLVELPGPRGGFYLAYELVMDLAGGAILIGVSMALFRRLVLKPKTLETKWDDYFALILLAMIPLVGFTLEGTRLLSTMPAWSEWSVIGNQTAKLMSNIGVSAEQAASMHDSLFWVHAALGLTLVAIIPFTKMRHLVTTPLNVITHPRRKEGTLEKIQDIEETEILGVGQISEFNTNQLLSFDACVRCGRCEEVCPSAISGMPYSPRVFVQNLRQAMITTLVNSNGNPNQELLGEYIPEEMPWSCTTCGACLSRCPAFVNPIDEIIDLRRYQALTTGKLPKSVADTLRNMERQGNPWGIPPEDRAAWAQDLGVRELQPGEETDVLFFLGCAFAYDERNKKVARAFVKILQNAGLDFATLGIEEGCCGETARRLGHEYLFQVFAEQNIEIFNSVKFNRIVTQCAHCFNTLKNEYPQMGGSFNVQHYTEFVSEMELPLEALHNNVGENHKTIAYHDSCYLGRYNGIYKQPRDILKRADISLTELPRKGENSFCCGGGGGQMWLETDPNTRINHRRLDDVIQSKVDIVATACPYCLLMFDDAIRSKGASDHIKVMDITELLELKLPAM